MATQPSFRIERDSMGEVRVPAWAKWGASTQRAVENFPISGTKLERGLIRALALLKGDAAEAVAALKEQQDGNLVVFGSGLLVQSLMRRDLVDEYVLQLHPLVLGSGRPLFPPAGPSATFRLVDSVTTATGVIIATYQPAPRTRSSDAGAAAASRAQSIPRPP